MTARRGGAGLLQREVGPPCESGSSAAAGGVQRGCKILLQASRPASSQCEYTELLTTCPGTNTRRSRGPSRDWASYRPVMQIAVTVATCCGLATWQPCALPVRPLSMGPHSSPGQFPSEEPEASGGKGSPGPAHIPLIPKSPSLL